MTRAQSILVSGTCQIDPVIQTLKVLHPTMNVEGLREDDIRSEAQVAAGRAMLDSASHWIGMLPGSALQSALRDRAQDRNVTTFEINPIVFRGFHPDCVYAFTDSGVLDRPGPYHSAILLWSYRRGLSLPSALRLFTEEVFTKLGYLHAFGHEAENMINLLTQAGLAAQPLWRRIRRGAPFMHTINHPTAATSVAITKAISESVGLPMAHTEPTTVVWDRLTDYSWPVYPEIASHLDVPGGYAFRFQLDHYPTLESYATAAWQVYQTLDPTSISFERMDDPGFLGALEESA